MPRLQVAESNTLKKKTLREEIEAETVLRTVRSPWVEAYVVPFVALPLFALPWVILVRYAILPPGYIAVSFAAILCEMLVWLYCHVHKLVVTENHVVLYGGFLADDIRRIPIRDIGTMRLSKNSWTERKYDFDTFEIESSAHPAQEIRMTRVQDASKLQAFIERLRMTANVS